MSAEQHNPDFDLDQDLFDFGEVGQGSGPEPEEDLDEILASFREPGSGEDLLAVPVARATARVAAKSTASTPARAIKAVATAPSSPVSATHAEHDDPEPLAVAATHRVPAQRAPRGPRLSKGLLAIALSVTAVNSILGVVVLRSSAPHHEVEAVGGASEAPVVPTSVASRDSHAPVAALPDPESSGTLPDHPALQTARDEISHGQYASARQRIYSLLAIIDRVDDGRRETLEAECQFLIAQALHLEALDRMGGSR